MRPAHKHSRWVLFWETMKKPAFQFYPGDWMKDPAVRSLSLEARGLWIDMLCLMHESDRRGYLQHISGKPVTHDQLARMTGCSAVQVSQLLQELKDSGVYSCTEHGTIFSRRMVRDELKRAKCVQAGHLSQTLRGGCQGSAQGGGQGQRQGEPQRNARASSSSSSSSSDSKATNGRPPESPPPLSIVDIRDTLHDYVQQSGLAWEPPDDAICKKIQSLWQKSLDDFGGQLAEMLKRRRKPTESYAWFVSVLKS